MKGVDSDRGKGGAIEGKDGAGAREGKGAVPLTFSFAQLAKGKV